MVSVQVSRPEVHLYCFKCENDNKVFVLSLILSQAGLLDRLGQVTVRSSPMATRLLLCEHAEKLQAAMVLKTHQTKHAELMNRAINAALQKSNTAVLPSLTVADVFFREVRDKRLFFLWFRRSLTDSFIQSGIT